LRGFTHHSAKQADSQVFARANRHDNAGALCLRFYPARTFVRCSAGRQKTSVLQTAAKQGVRPNAVYGGISRREKAGAAKLALDFLVRDGRQ
jgi:hypothetical protein